MERHVPELYDWVRNKDEAAPEVRCAILDAVSWFPGAQQHLWIDVRVRCPGAERYTKSASKSGAAAKTEKTKRYGVAVRALVFETDGRLSGEDTQWLRDLVTTTAANECSPHAVGRWRTQLERVLLTAQADTYLRALGSKVAERPAAEPPLLLVEHSVHSFVWMTLHCDSHVKVRLTGKGRGRGRGASHDIGRPRGAEAGLCVMSFLHVSTHISRRVICVSHLWVHGFLLSHAAQSPVFANVCRRLASSAAAAASMSTWRRSTGQRSR